MTLPAPNLDDRTFQQLVDEAKRFVQQRCPSWTNHNVSDPGVTLIEAFAWMTDLLLYRLNRVPDRNYVKFLDLVGVKLFPPTAARAELSFRLSSHQDTEVRIARGTCASTPRTATEQAITFATLDDLVVVPAVSEFVGSMIEPGQLRDHTPHLGLGQAFACFAERPKVGDALYIGLDRPAPANLLLLEITCEVGGHGIDPRDPPLAWEAWDGQGWTVCDLERDTTGGLNISGAVELHLPATHDRSTVAGRSAAWVRCRVVDAAGRAPYRSSPRVLNCTGSTVGGDVAAIHGEEITDEVVGTSEGVSGQTFLLKHAPVVLDAEPIVVEIALTRPPTESELPGPRQAARDLASELPAHGLPPAAQPAGGGDPVWEPWERVQSFADSGADDRHYCLDAATGEISFGPSVRLPDGGVRDYGAVPPKGAIVRVRSYRTGGGRSGNVEPRAISVLRSSIPYVAAVYNRRTAAGGVDGETVEEARVRGPVVLRTRNRAVTVEDYEELTREAAPEAARVRCVPVTDGPDTGALRVLVVPAAPQDNGRIRLEHLILGEPVGERIRAFLDERRVIGARVSVEPPSYVGLTVVARLRARPTADPDRIREDALRALYEYFNPLSGGPDGDGWPYGRPVQVGEVYGVLSRVRGLDHVEEALLFAANPITGERSGEVPRIDLGPTNLVFSFEHQVEVD
jgi:Baseplate J-like protein